MSARQRFADPAAQKEEGNLPSLCALGTSPAALSWINVQKSVNITQFLILHITNYHFPTSNTVHIGWMVSINFRI